jgi:TolB-like protein
MSEETQRRLTAIVSADVVGYSRLMGADEVGTHARLKARYAELVGPAIDRHGGRVVKLIGDGLLAEFVSVVDAVAWALEVQEAVAEAESATPAEERIVYRVGVNLGDVIVDGDDIFGDGVNVAARLQEIAEPGGICISDIVQGQIRDKLDTLFVDGGAVEMKNITQPVHVWRWSPDGMASSAEAYAGDTPPVLPDKPSLAVLPFDNMSGDPEQEYLVDGMVEDILTILSKVPHLFVIARNSSFTYKGKTVDVRQVGRELGVRYVVEGSVRKAGNKVRVTAQLVECATGGHIWADRFEGDLDDVFALQDRITEEIVTAMEVNLTMGEQARFYLERSGSPLVYEGFHKGSQLYRDFSKHTHLQALTEFEKALEINPDYTPALFLYGLTLVDLARFGWSADRDAAFEAALEVAERCIKVDPDYGEAYTIISYARSFQGRHDDAVEAADRAVALSPNSHGAFHMAAMTHIYAGNFETGRDYEEQASRLSPMDHEVAMVDLARAHYHLGAFEEARRIAQRVLHNQPRWLTAQTILLASLWYLDRKEEALEVADMIKRGHTAFSVARWSSGWPYRRDEDLAALVEPLREAGLPE